MEEDGFTVVATVLKLKNWRQLRRFFRLNGGVESQLRSAPGPVRHQVKADLLRLKLYTVSVCDGDVAVEDFVRTSWSDVY